MQRQVQKVLKEIAPWITESPNITHKTNHKGVRGRIGIVGGARDYAGAPYYASISAMRLGADLAYVICTKDASQVIKSYSPDLIVSPILDCPEDTEFYSSDLDCLLDRLHALVIGPGLGREKLLQDRACGLFKAANRRSLPIVLDADGLSIVYDTPTLVQSNSNVLLTPNMIELQRLLNSLYSPKKYELKNMATDEIRSLVQKYSQDMKVAVLAKGLTDIICDHSFNVEFLTNENSGSSRRCGGQGDITSGLAAVYSYWINEAIKSERLHNVSKMAWAGYLAAITTRRCNELAFKEHNAGMLTSDMIQKVQEAFRSILHDKDQDPSVFPTKFSYIGLLSKDEIDRYSRQMIMDEFGPQHQLNLKSASALIIGAGGLGCPAAGYLAAAGIGRLGVVDHDQVEVSNLHRQILHNMAKVGMNKTDSIKQAILAINPNVDVILHPVKLTRYNAVDLVEKYDVILDCTDNLLTRYMISDACVFAKKPLISGAALKMDGQLTVYNYDEKTPCFRCLFPEPPSLNAVGSCSDNGVLGVLPGVIGLHQALEAVKIGSGMRPAYAGKMLLFDGQQGLFRHVIVGSKKPGCEGCGKNSILKRDLIDYATFCGESCVNNSKPEVILTSDERITVEQYSDVLDSNEPHVLVDVRPKSQSDISRFRDALQLPVMFMLENKDKTMETIGSQLKSKATDKIYVVCRRGIASQRGTQILKEYFVDYEQNVTVKDIIGGMTTWANKVDPHNYSCL